MVMDSSLMHFYQFIDGIIEELFVLFFAQLKFSSISSLDFSDFFTNKSSRLTLSLLYIRLNS